MVPVFKNVLERLRLKTSAFVDVFSVVSKIFVKLVNNRHDHLEICGVFLFCSTADPVTAASDRIDRNL